MNPYPPPYPGESHQMLPKGGPGGHVPVPEPLQKLPVSRVCPACHQQSLTTVLVKLKLTGWALILFLGVCGLIACCQDGWKQFKHKCSYCGFSFGSYEPPLTTSEKVSLAGAVCCLFLVPIIIVIVYLVTIFVFIKTTVPDDAYDTWTETLNGGR
eukprot:GFUD01016055.1.p1 GENE.GFUD01016055.1~~GFUD01016055.1.p1  ORF type:complete len:155 (-),score=35.69 GFUD01016055.1:89-553(-)